MPERRSDKDNGSSAPMIASAWNIVGAMLGCSLAGYLIGKKMGDFWTGTLIGMFIGLAYCGYEIWKLIQKLK